MAVEFPAFIRLEHRPDGSAKSRFIAEVDNTLEAAERRFTEFSSEAKRQLNAAMSVDRNAFGSLDVGTADAKAAAQAAQLRAAAARELAAATAIAAREQGDYSQQARLAIAATEAQAREEQEAAAAALKHAEALEQVQTVLNRNASATGAVITGTGRMAIANDNAAGSVAMHRAGLQQLSFQLNDVATMFALGARPTQIFASQIGQVTQAVQMMSGGTSKLAAFLGGPWGIAVTSAAVVLSPFIAKLFDAEEATKQVEFATYAFGDAQSILGTVMDLTTGKINTQSEALLALARAQAVAGQVEARRQQAEARGEFGEISAYRAKVSGGFGGGLSVSRTRSNAGDIIEAFQEGTLSLREAERGLKSLLNTGLLTENQYLEAAQAVTKFGLAAENLKVFEKLDEALGGDRGAVAGFLKPSTTRKPRTARKDGSADRLAEFGEDAAKKLENIRDRFIDIPPAVAEANRATRELDDLISDLERRKPEGFTELVDQAERLKDIIPGLELQKTLSDLSDQAERRRQIDQLTLQGREAEAAALQQIWQLQKQFGPLSEDQREEVERIAQAEERRIEANQKLLELQSAYLDTTRGVRGEIEAIFAGEGDLGNFKKIFQRLQSKVLVEQIFGDVLRDLDKYVKENTGIEDSVDHLAEETVRAGDAALNFADTINLASQRIAAGGTGSLESEFDAFFGTGSAAAGTAANDNVGAGGEIVVTGPRNSVNSLTPERYFEHMSKRIVDPMLAGLDEIFGTKFFGQLSGALSGALYGYSTGGAVGGVLGGLKGLVDDAFGGAGGALSNALGKGLAGAQAGTMVAGLGDLFGLKMSNTGAQIGGAIGSFLPIPGGQIIGAVAGGLIGKLFGGNKTANAVLTAGGTSIGGKDKGNYGVASGLGGGVQDAISRIAEQLDAEIGNYFVTIGTRGDEFRVNTGGTSLKLKNGAKGFGQDEAAAIAFALADAIADGAIKGLKASEARLLQTGKDIDEQIRKILDFRSVFTRLRQYKDPVGAALDELNEEFDRLKDIFTEAGASAAEFAQLEELYGIERANAIKEASERFTSSLRDLLDEMNMGDMGLSLRDRRAAAQTRYDELASRVRAGDATAFDDFAEAARTLLGIERELSGSTNAYFELFNEVRGLTQSALDQQTAAIDAATGRDSPFAGGPTARDDQGVIDGLDRLGSRLIDGLGGLLGAKLDAVNRNLGDVIASAASKPTTIPLMQEKAWW